MSTAIPVPPRTWWTFYSDSDGHRAVLTITVDDGLVTLTTSAGESLSFSAHELAGLRQDLESAAIEGKLGTLATAHIAKPPVNEPIGLEPSGECGGIMGGGGSPWPRTSTGTAT
jgi:hypothetical protein